MTSPTYESLRTELCAHLGTIPGMAWSPTGVYTATEKRIRIYKGRIPDETMENAIAVNVYSDDPYRDSTTRDIKVQIRARGTKDPDSPGVILAKIFTALDEKTHYRLDNGTYVLRSHRHLRAPEEPDANQRWSRPDSYTFTVNPS